MTIYPALKKLSIIPLLVLLFIGHHDIQYNIKTDS